VCCRSSPIRPRPRRGSEDYEQLFLLTRDKVEPGALVVADNVLSHAETLAAYSQTRQADPTVESVTVPLDRGLELSVILTDLS
jgi:predicted O-methyltransferase YrrM